MLFSWTKLWQEKKTRGGNILPTLNLLETLKDLIPSFMLLGDKWVSRCECNSHLDGKNWPKMQINNSSCAQKQPSNQEQEHFPIFSTYRILASLSANISQSYVWKCSLIGQFLKHTLEINTQSSHSITHVYWDFSRVVHHIGCDTTSCCTGNAYSPSGWKGFLEAAGPCWKKVPHLKPHLI